MAAGAAASSFPTDPERGLTSDEARARLGKVGPNTLVTERPRPAWRRVAAQFKDALVLVLLAATGISMALWIVERSSALPYEAIAILAIVVLNAMMGFIQETRAESAMAELRELSADDAAVVRDGKRRKVHAADIVPGDVIILHEGDTIPADARLVEASALRTTEAALTGESTPVLKDVESTPADAPLGDRHDMVFSGTAVTSGHGRAIVVGTGMSTEVGRIAGMLRDAPTEPTPLQRELRRIGRVLGVVVIAIAAVMIGTIILTEDVRGARGLVEVFILGVALAVAAVPEGLPAIVTAVLSMGVRRMARRNAIVRHLVAVETLGSATVIASDKTGTLTRNEMTVRAAQTASGRVNFGGTGYGPSGAVERADGGAIEGPLRAELDAIATAALLANDATVIEADGRWMVQGDPTEGALIVAARKAGLAADAVTRRFPRVDEIPFTSERKLMTTVHRDADGGTVAFTKGAPEALLPRCTGILVGDTETPLTDARRAEIARANDTLTGEALRTLGVARRGRRRGDPSTVQPDGDVERQLVFVGLVGMIDPPRDEARDAVALARMAGIRPIMITGDHPRTASVIARELGIGDSRVVSGSDIQRMSDADLEDTASGASIYARVSPEHKLRIVRALKARGEVAAMTGDGVNDAPALKTADIGIAMGKSGTGVAREAADIVLVDDNFATIVVAVEEGRAIFANIRKFLSYLLSSNIGEVLAMFFGVVLADRLGMPREQGRVVLPLLATQILWINMVTDGVPALALGIDPAGAHLMRRPPRQATERVVTGHMWRGIMGRAMVMAAATLAVVDASMPGGMIAGAGSLVYSQTMAFTTLTLAQLFNVFNARSEVRSAFSRPFPNRWLWGAVALSLGLHFVVIYLPALRRPFGTVPLTAVDWLRCTLAASTVLAANELAKLLMRLPRPARRR